MDKGSALDDYRWLRECVPLDYCGCQLCLVVRGVIVEIDESQFRHKPKVCTTVRSHSSKVGVIFLSISTIEVGHPLPNSGCLGWWIHPTHRYLAICGGSWQVSSNSPPDNPGTYCYRNNNKWRAYTRVASLPPVASHSTVNHSVHFVDLDTEVHPQHVESYWARAKQRIKGVKGCHAHEIPSYLNEFMWRERFGKAKRQAFHSICQDIVQVHPA